MNLLRTGLFVLLWLGSGIAATRQAHQELRCAAAAVLAAPGDSLPTAERHQNFPAASVVPLRETTKGHPARYGRKSRNR